MNVILVDDEINALELLKMEGADIPAIASAKSFTHPGEALAYAQKNPVDIAVLDVEMPEMNGIALGQALKKLHSGIVLIYISAYDAYAMEAYRLRAPVYLEKPYSREDIHAAFHTAEKLVGERESVRRQAQVFVRTFGYFDVYVNGELVHFSNKKSKELLALLVDRRGAEVTNEQAITTLWEDAPNDIYHQSKLRRVIKDLKDTLIGVGAGDILITQYNSKAINTDAFSCDYYWLINGDKEVQKTYNGKYMQEYSWAEETVADLYRICGL